VNFNNLVPDDTFIGKYMSAASVLETATSYDFWCAMWALGTACGRGVVIPRPHAPIYLNWYVMLVAESGVTRKSTAVRMARDVISDVLGPEAMVEGKSTPEYLFSRLAKTPQLAIAVSELVTFLGRESYVIELPALLTDMYDCPAERRGGSMSRGERIIVDPYVTFMTASTPTWLMGAVNPTVIEGGFTSRCLFILDEKPKQKVAWPTESVDMNDAKALLADTVSKAQRVKTINLMPSAMQKFSLWYKRRDTTTNIAFLASFNAREDAHVLRAAACLAVNDGTFAIDRNHLSLAIKLIAHAKAGGMLIFSGGGQGIKVAQGMDKISRLLIDAGGVGVGHTPLYAGVRHYMNANDFKICIAYMNELGMLIIGVENRNGGGIKPRRYFRTDDTTKKDRMLALREAML
jgi:hypothetical protein